MKKGFALLETMIVITFLCVSLLLLYSTFTNMINNSKKNIFYDDAANIYKAYYVKEYLALNNMDKLIDSNNIKKISCTDFPGTGCNTLVNELKINNMYITKVDLKEYPKENFSSSFNNYIASLSNKSKNEYRLILEFKNEEAYSYASIGLNGEEDE